MRPPRFSVLMPVYNRAHLIRSAVQSIMDQTFEDWELIIVDDGSNDNTWAVLEEVNDKRIKAVKKRHSGLVRTLNEGIALCSGDIIVKQDSDDLSLPNRLEVIDREMRDADFFYHGMYQSWENENPDDAPRRKYVPALPIERKRLLKEQYIPGCFAFKRENYIPYRQLTCSEDWMILLDYFFQNRKFAYSNEGLYEYILRIDSNSLINEDTGTYEDDEKEMQKILKEYGVKNFKYSPRESWKNRK